MIKQSPIILLLSLFFLAACARSEPAIVREPVSDVPDEEIILTEEKVEDSIVQHLEFVIDDQLISINLNEVPIIKHYLAQHNNRDLAVQNMMLEPVFSDSRDYYHLRFNCNGDLCSVLLIDTGSARTYLLADQVTFQTITGLDNRRQLYLIERGLANQSHVRGRILVFDFNTFQAESLLSDTIDVDQIRQPLWPIQSVRIEDNHIYVELPDIDEPTDTNLDAWSESDARETVTHEITF